MEMNDFLWLLCASDEAMFMYSSFVVCFNESNGLFLTQSRRFQFFPVRFWTKLIFYSIFSFRIISGHISTEECSLFAAFSNSFSTLKMSRTLKVKLFEVRNDIEIYCLNLNMFLSIPLYLLEPLWSIQLIKCTNYRQISPVVVVCFFPSVQAIAIWIKYYGIVFHLILKEISTIQHLNIPLTSVE